MSFRRNGGFISVTRDIFDGVTLPNTAVGIYDITTQNFLKSRLRWPFSGWQDESGTLVAFTSSGQFTIPFGITSIDYLCVSGGGGGGITGGAGAGGLLQGASYDVDYGDLFTIVVGAGGPTTHDRSTGSSVFINGDTNGTNSSFFRANTITSNVSETITSVGGGSGDTQYTGNGGGPSPLNGGMFKGSNGGSGGGSGSNSAIGPSTLAGGSGVPGQGNNGGSGPGFPGSGSGGGGGAGANGNGGSPSGGGNGGAGLLVPWATPYGNPSGYFAGGGGGGCFNAPRVARTGGVGGGGSGKRYSDGTPATDGNGVVNTGGGGGGNAPPAGAAGTGGSGIVIFKLNG